MNLLALSYNDESITADICKIIEAIECPIDESITIIADDFLQASEMLSIYRKGKI